MIPNFKYNVLGTDKGTGSITTASTASSIVSGSETNQIYTNIKGLAGEVVLRDLGFYNETLKYEIMKQVDKYDKDKVISLELLPKAEAIFQKKYVELLNRGYSQKESKRSALIEAKKYFDEEKSYWMKTYNL